MLILTDFHCNAWKMSFLFTMHNFVLNVTNNCYELARMYLKLPLQQWGASNVYLLMLSSWKVNIAENPIGVMGL